MTARAAGPPTLRVQTRAGLLSRRDGRLKWYIEWTIKLNLLHFIGKPRGVPMPASAELFCQRVHTWPDRWLRPQTVPDLLVTQAPYSANAAPLKRDDIANFCRNIRRISRQLDRPNGHLAQGASARRAGVTHYFYASLFKKRLSA